ncbi:MAG: gamma-glutamyltransferase [Synergistaceae bacterium]|jgi:gamma-glutamyltranspeptidase/glutathione hydrolase|nr:gamma-glutamyltransferase [Synergistaceae bacterium]
MMRKSVSQLCTITALIIALTVIPAIGAHAAASKPVIGGENGLVVSTHWIADAVGQKILDDGGNAIDAAAAVGYALAVVHPTAGNIGGGGFAVIHLANGETKTLDFREMAPAAAYREMYLSTDVTQPRKFYFKDGTEMGNESLFSYKAAGVPGSVAGFNEMISEHGTKSLAEIIGPSIKLAREGFKLTAGGASSLNGSARYFNEFDGSKKYFTKADGTPFETGELFVQSDLADTLQRIVDNGTDGFYKGRTAELIVEDMPKYNGIMTLQDLADYRAVWRDPAQGTYRGYKIFSMSPPSSGGTHIVQILNTMENADIGSLGFAAAATVHIMVEAMRYAYADRSEYMGDPDYVDVPVAQLTDKDYAKSIYDEIISYDNAHGGPRARPSSEINPGLGPIHEGEETTHYSVIDKWGNAVGVTYTINMGYGCKVAVDGAGFFMNNEMDDFMSVPGVPNGFGLIQGEANNIQPGKRPLSSMSPTIVLNPDDSIYMVVGSPGGSTIITTVLQIISDVIDHSMTISEAAAAPRIHHQWYPERVTYEKNGLTNDTIRILSDDMGYQLALTTQGDVDAILVDPESGVIYGAHDPRTYDVPPAEDIDLDPGTDDGGGGSGGSCDAGQVGLAALALAGFVGFAAARKLGKR